MTTDRTFIIESEYLDKVQSQLYGYMVSEDGLIFIDEIPDKITNTGFFSLVQRENETISIRQDFCGSFGLFVYKHDQYFVVSNSFFRLAEFLKGKISINKKAVQSLLYAYYSPCYITDTLVNEIIRLDSQAYIIINITNKKIEIHNNYFPYFSRNISSKESLQELDKWYTKWVKVYKNIIDSGRILSVDLSGGMDTRIIFSMLLNSKADLGSVYINSHEKVNLSKDSDDYRIAQTIAEDYKVTLNRKLILEKSGKISAKESYQKCKYYSFGETITNKYETTDYSEPVFFAKGLCSSIKGASWGNVENHKNQYISPYDDLNSDQNKTLISSIQNKISRKKFSQYIDKQIEKCINIMSYNDDRSTAMIFQKIYTEKTDTRKVIDWMAQNQFIISPYIDPAIVCFNYLPIDSSKYSLAESRLFLAALILDRYSKQLSEYEIQGRKIPEEMLKEIKHINESYPAEIDITAQPLHPVAREQITKKTISKAELGTYLESIWTSEDFEKVMDKIIGHNHLQKIINETDKDKINFQAPRINALFAIYEIYKIVK